MFNKRNSLQLKAGNTCLTLGEITHSKMNETKETKEMKELIGTKDTNNVNHVREDLPLMKDLKNTMSKIIVLQVSDQKEGGKGLLKHRLVS